MTDELAAAVERLRRDKAGDRSAYGEFTLPCTRRLDDRRIVADAYLAREAELAAWTDPTPLTLDVLRRELGEPVFHTSSEIVSWNVDGDIVLLPNAASRWAKVGGRVVEGKVETIGQLRRILSVIRETNGGK